jgi:hypothetical protein
MEWYWYGKALLMLQHIFSEEGCVWKLSSKSIYNAGAYVGAPGF